jgi:hypothetical protein
MSRHESDEEIYKDVFAKLSLAYCAALVGMNIWVPVSLAAGAQIAALQAGPHTICIKTEFVQYVWMNAEIVELPFSRSSSRIARSSQDTGYRRIESWIKVADPIEWRVPIDFPAMACWVLPRQKSGSRRHTHRQRINIVELHALRGKAVSVGRKTRLTAIATNPLLTKIVEHDEDDVWSLLAA